MNELKHWTREINSHFLPAHSPMCIIKSLNETSQVVSFFCKHWQQNRWTHDLGSQSKARNRLKISEKDGNRKRGRLGGNVLVWLYLWHHLFTSERIDPISLTQRVVRTSWALDRRPDARSSGPALTWTSLIISFRGSELWKIERSYHTTRKKTEFIKGSSAKTWESMIQWMKLPDEWLATEKNDRVVNSISLEFNTCRWILRYNYKSATCVVNYTNNKLNICRLIFRYNDKITI